MKGIHIYLNSKLCYKITNKIKLVFCFCFSIIVQKSFILLNYQEIISEWSSINFIQQFVLTNSILNKLNVK